LHVAMAPCLSSRECVTMGVYEACGDRLAADHQLD
jgi:hypothetical protein